MSFVELNAIETITIKGNDDSTNLMASIATLKVRNLFKANFQNSFIRSSATAESINVRRGIGTGIYFQPIRVVFGTDYDPETGIQRQRTKGGSTTIQIDQHLTIDVAFEGFDMERFLESDPAVRSGMLNAWIDSAMDSYFLTLEAIFVRGVVDSTIAYADRKPNQVLVIDPATIVDETTARAVYNQIGEMLVHFKQLVTKRGTGIAISDLEFAMSPQLYQKLATYLPSFAVTESVFSRLATGEIRENAIQGIRIRTAFILGQAYKRGTDQQLNKDLDFDFSTTHGIIYHYSAVAGIIGMEQTKFIENPRTLNIHMVSKNLGSLPEILDRDLLMVVKSEAVTPADITDAKAMVYDPNIRDYSRSYQNADWDNDEPLTDLATAITVTDLGELPYATSRYILAGVVAKNPDIVIGGIQASNIKVDLVAKTGTAVISAVIGSSLYTGIKDVTFQLPGYVAPTKQAKTEAK